MKNRIYISAILILAFAYSIIYSQSPYDSLKYYYPYKDGVSFSKYKERRLKLSKYMSARAIGIIFSSSYYSPIGNFYQPNLINSNMFYLSGMPDQKSVLLIIPGNYEYNGVKTNDLIFLDIISPKNTLWYGRKVNLYDAEGIYGFKKAFEFFGAVPIQIKLRRDKNNRWDKLFGFVSVAARFNAILFRFF